MNTSPVTLSFDGLLKERDPELGRILDNIKKKGLLEWVPLLSFDEGAHSGYPHLLNVERNVNKLVPDAIKQGFSNGEIFLLLATIFLHDIGKLTRSLSPGKGKTRRHHFEQSRDIIEQCWAELGLPDERIARQCARIAYYHGFDKPYKKKTDIREYNMVSLEPYGQLRISFLTALLRIADEAENYWTRSLQKYLFKQIKQEGPLLVKAVRRLIEDVEFCLPGECIILHVPETLMIKEFVESHRQYNSDRVTQPFVISIEEISHLNDMQKKIDLVLQAWSGILQEHDIHINHVYFLYRNQLLDKIVVDHRNGDIMKKTLIDVIRHDATEKRPGIKQLLDALTKLALGSYGYKKFSWSTFEAQVGQTLSDREKWILKMMNNVTTDLSIVIDATDAITVNFEREQVKAIYRLFGFNERGEK